jgi:hypothetical protein
LPDACPVFNRQFTRARGQTIVLSSLRPNHWLSFRRIGQNYGLTPMTMTSENLTRK